MSIKHVSTLEILLNKYCLYVSRDGTKKVKGKVIQEACSKFIYNIYDKVGGEKPEINGQTIRADGKKVQRRR